MEKKLPKDLDIHYLKKAQESEQDYKFYQKKLDDKYAEKEKTKNVMLISLILTLVFLIISSSNPGDKGYEFLYGISGVVFLFSGFFYWSSSSDDGMTFERTMTQKSLEKKDEFLSKVKCDYLNNDGTYYVYLDDGRKIEVDEY